MNEAYEAILQANLSAQHYQKLIDLRNPKLHRFVADTIELCTPTSVFVCTDSEEDIEYVRARAIDAGEETPLAMQGHTVHFDGYHDQARDKENTRYLTPPDVNLGASLNSIEKEQGLAEIRSYLKGSMSGREMFVRFFCLGPTKSKFSISGVQLTDSAYVAHSEDLLYRPGYEQFGSLGDSGDFFRVLHSAGELTGSVSANADKRRIYIDIEDDVVYSVNTQYAGNTVGFKKLALRLAIRKADREGWLAEHMLIMGVHGPAGRVTYFAGAFPSFCGKTSTAMLPGETIVGDDIVYIRAIDGEARAVNVECGIFGIIQDVNPKDDPLTSQVVTRPGEVIFSNVLVKEGRPYWLGMGCELPSEGVNYSGRWWAGKKDEGGKGIAPSHKNARYTISLRKLANLDSRADDPAGVPLRGIIYGGRDSDTWVPVQQSFDWAHGVITVGASLESETTAATLGLEGVRQFQPMSNLDFVSIPLGRYVQNHLGFGNGIQQPPLIFGVNYFLKNREGEYLNGMADKSVWVKWMELRAHNDVGAVVAPTGYVPLYPDLKKLFRDTLGTEYTEEQYVEQFRIRVQENLAKIERIENIYSTQVTDTPEIISRILAAQRDRLLESQKEYGNYISPFLLTETPVA
jgi:phosphoenolpyruvate carboxykinase (GTP)